MKLRAPFDVFLFRLFCPFLCLLPAGGAPVITEIMASNAAGIMDEDGAASDWVEIYNPDPQPVNLDGWFLTDNALAPTKWRFPSVTVASGGFLKVWASGKDRHADPANLHTNFQLNAGGEYLALTTPGGVVRTSEYAPQFPAMETDESFGVPFDMVSLAGPSTAASILVPTDNSLGLTWTQPGVLPPGTWITGTASAGFGMPVLGFAIQERASSVAVTSITGAEALLNGTNAVDDLTAMAPVVNFIGSTSLDGRFGNGVPTLHGGNRENFAIKATGTLIIPTDGPWTFHVSSDDGFRLRIDGAVVMEVTGTRTLADSFGTRTLTAGNHELVLTYFGSTGGDEVELSAAPGATTSFSSFFKLIGDTAAGGLAIVTTPPAGILSVGTDLGAAMQNVNASAYMRVPFEIADPGSVESLALSLAANDGFVAYLNGTEVARRLAPAPATFDSAATGSRSLLDSLTPEVINLTAWRTALVPGSNVLALHGLNNAASDNSFYLAPRLDRSTRSAGASLFFRKPTPGAANTTPGYLGSVADTEFLPKRGVFTAPIDVAITSATAGATIRYTINGSTPTLTNGVTYASPIHLETTTVIRAAAFRDGFEPTNVDTNTYLFLDDVIRQGSAPYGSKPGPDWPNAGSVAGQVINYGMDPAIVNNTNATIGGQAQVKAALLALPTVCISTDLPNLFHTTTGIYTHPGNHGTAWERPASLEMIGDPNTAEGGFQSNCGVRIRGGYSRSPDNPKHSFRMFFRGEYGTGTLDYPIYGGEGAGEFDGFDIQCSQNYSWSYHRDTTHNGLREIWSRDVQRDLGHPATRGRFVHLYLNAVYWGLYQIQERAEAAFGATYTGGIKEEFDVIKHTGPNGNYTTEATDGYFVTIPGGGDSAWKKLWTGSRACYFINTDKNPTSPTAPLISTKQEKNAAYFKLMGLQADGRTPSGDPVLLDVDNLIDYVMITCFAQNRDAPITAGGDRPNNFFSLRGRFGNRGFIHIQHDGEHSLNTGNADRWGPWASPATSGPWNSINSSNPQYFHQDLTPNAEYKIRFADRIYRAFYNNGPMTVPNNQARLDVRASQIEPAIIAESARWGDSKGTPALNATHWRSARTATRNWFNSRSNAFLNEAKAKGFFPATLPPDFNQRGGSVPGGFGVVLTNPNTAGGTIYYTTDGSDPRPPGAGANTIVLVPEFAAASYLVPSTTNGGSDLTMPQWTTLAAPPNEAQWASGQMGFGWMTRTFVANTDFSLYTKTNLLAQMQPAGGTSSASVYVRVPFTVSAAQMASLATLRVRARFDDAFVVYLNGVEAGRKNTNIGFVPTWDGFSSTNVSNTAAVTLQVLDLTSARNLLVEGQNLIAFHALNGQTTGDDFLFSPQVEIDTVPSVATPVFTGPIALFGPTTIRTRILKGTEWSALNEATFFPDTAPASAANLVISEFSYNPLGAQTPSESPYSSSDFEFVEVQNISPLGVDLTGVRFVGAMAFAFTGTPQQLVLPPGGRLVVAAHRDAFAQRYGAQPAVGPFAGSLDNSTELIHLVAGDGSTIKQFTYNDRAPWPEAADGEGYSLVLINPAANPDHANPANWRSSTSKNGNPGAPKGTTYLAWKTAHNVPDDLADIDRDGLTPFAEYVLGTSPATSDAEEFPRAAVASISVDQTLNDYLTLVFKRRLAADDAAIEVQCSPSLVTAEWSSDHAVFVSESNNGDGTATMIYRSRQPITPGQTLFMRLKMVLR